VCSMVNEIDTVDIFLLNTGNKNWYYIKIFGGTIVFDGCDASVEKLSVRNVAGNESISSCIEKLLFRSSFQVLM
jgi:hypothetical protein